MFARDLRNRFGPAAFYNAEVSLNELRQETSEATYITEFEALSVRTPGFTADNLLNRFLAGLKDEIHRELVLLNPATLQIAMGMARIAEQKITASRPWQNRTWASRSLQNTMTPPLTITKAPTTSPPIRRLTVAEMTARREKGLCYNCDERFTVGHRCKVKFQCLILEDPEETDDESICATIEAPSDCSGIEKHNITVEEHPSISFHALQGRFVASTLRLQGTINGRSLTILVDSGSTHNIIQTRVAKHLQLPVEPTRDLNVTIGNGDQLLCDGACNKVPLRLENVTFEVDLYLLPIYGADVVLGAHWLAEIGPALFYYRQLWMSFQHRGTRVTLQGIRGTGELSHISMGQLQHDARSNAIASYFHLEAHPNVEHVSDDFSPTSMNHQLDIDTNLSQSQVKELEHLLTIFAGVFANPQGLPPPRTTTHKISLLPGTAPVNVKRYRYPHYQKDEIEK
ncbi:unnamed protein product [Rhodiola kirilowii]